MSTVSKSRLPKRLIKKLEEARDLIKTGWTQGRYVSNEKKETCYCAMGAISKVSNDGETIDRLSRWLTGSSKSLNVYATNKVDGGEMSAEDAVITWNDAPNRTKRQVLSAFTSAINRASVR